MGKHDGIYKRESFDEHYPILLQEMGIHEADIKLLMSPTNTTTLTVMKSKDGNMTSWMEHTAAPHLDYRMTAKIGEMIKLTTPFPCTITWTKKTDEEFCRKMEINGKVIMSHLFMDNFGFTAMTTIEGGSLHCKEVFRKTDADITGFFEMVKEENMVPLLQHLLPGFTADKWEEMRLKGLGMRLKMVKDTIILDEQFWGDRKMMTFHLDEAVDYINEELGIEETRILTKLCPGRFKMVCKGKRTGKITEHELAFTHHGIDVTSICAGIKATRFYKRCPDIEGRWRVVTKEGESGFLDACGMPEHMKREIMVTKDIHEIMRLGWGKIWHKCNSKFFPIPGEITFKMGEQFEIELPHLGKAQEIITDIHDILLICIKLKAMTLNIRMKVSGDFMIREFDVDGCPTTRMKEVMVREADMVTKLVKHMHI